MTRNKFFPPVRINLSIADIYRRRDQRIESGESSGELAHQLIKILPAVAQKEIRETQRRRLFEKKK